MDAAKMRYLAERGHYGHSAMLDPGAYVAANLPQEETAMQQAVRELPGDIASAFSPSGLSNTIGSYLDTAKTMATDIFKK